MDRAKTLVVALWEWFLCWSHWSHQEQVNALRQRSCVYFWELKSLDNLGFPPTNQPAGEPRWVQVNATGFSLNWFLLAQTRTRHQHMLRKYQQSTKEGEKRRTIDHVSRKSWPIGTRMSSAKMQWKKKESSTKCSNFCLMGGINTKSIQSFVSKINLKLHLKRWIALPGVLPKTLPKQVSKYLKEVFPHWQIYS